MKRTPLKRKTPLKAKTGLKSFTSLKRKPMKIKLKRNHIPQTEIDKILERSQERCEFCEVGKCIDPLHLQVAHIVHRGMGGVQGSRASIINDARNMGLVCYPIHGVMDKRIRELQYGVTSEIVIEHLKGKIGWSDWYNENQGVVNR